ncbi:phosphotransferase enzyme family protein [Streptomyces sp. SBT349]|uniref:phosphotransferase enzyme family protein n=1 Tax=Streptomyces sp. SBT349 TaxID=1580539 RepID=UPI00069E62EA|nr:phosphotransferase [Streptomyces sp. SBT349]
MLCHQDIADALATHWNVRDAHVAPLLGGMNSSTWTVSHRNRRWVAKAVPLGAPEEQFRHGLRLASRVEDAGIPTGAPEPTNGGHRVISAGAHALALLRWVDGRELDGGAQADAVLMGATLGRVHAALGTTPVARAEALARFDLLPPDQGAALALRPWIRPAVTAAVARLRALRPETLTWGPAHGDPAPEHFRLDPVTGRCGLIDWGSVGTWPLMYDVATLVLDAGGPARARPLLDAYLHHSGVPEAEAERALIPLLDFRHALVAVYYAGRIVRGDMTGTTELSKNEAQLETARRWLHRHPATAQSWPEGRAEPARAPLNSPAR